MRTKKVLNKIAHTNNSGQTTPLGTKPNDECYTDFNDILTEFSRWAAFDKFRGKNIICPCDWDIVEGEDIYSITITFKESSVEVVGNAAKQVKSIQYSLWEDDSSQPVTIDVKEEDIEEFLLDKLTCNFLRVLSQKARAWGIKSVTGSGYNPATGKGIRFQDVDYSKYDICCTNPPFSLYGEFMKSIVGKIDFIVLAPFLNRVTPNVGLPLMLKQAYLGYGAQMSRMTFRNPTRKNGYNGEKTVNCDWISSFPEAQQERNKENHERKLYIRYDDYKDDYTVMENMTMKDGTHPLRMPASLIPEDYYGWVFTSINVLDVIDMRDWEWYGTNFKKYYNSINPIANPFAHKCSDSMVEVSGSRKFHGIVLKRINKGDEDR